MQRGAQIVLRHLCITSASVGSKNVKKPSKNNVFKLLLIEASVIGTIGSIIGTILGVIFCYYLQEVGIDISEDTANSTIIMPSVMRAYVTPNLFFIGFIPGLFSILFGTALAGRGIYKRETARLFKELEV